MCRELVHALSAASSTEERTRLCELLLDDPTLRDDAAARKQVEAILHDNSHPAFVEMFGAVADRVYGNVETATIISEEDE
jgi:hypothetical protein